MNQLWMVTARTCNLACHYCYQGAENHERDYLAPRGLESLMSKDVADKALLWALEWAPTEGLRLVFYGGEPTLAWPLIQSVVPEWSAAFKAAGKPLQFSITTNGSLLNDERRAWMTENNIGILLSLDGPPHTHNLSRPAKGGRPSWETINPEAFLAWRPGLEIAWTLSPSGTWCADDLDDMVSRGFKGINFNVDFLSDWTHEDLHRLQELGKRLAKHLAAGTVRSNWEGKYDKAAHGKRMERPCGLATGMLAVTPEGDLYPSQEMAFTVYEDGRAPGTAAHYRVGNVVDGLDPFAVARVGLLKTEDMRPPKGFDCGDCIATAMCIGGCHCRYVGQDGVDPASRMDIPAGYCPSNRALLTGMMQGFWIAGKLRPVKATPPAIRRPEQPPVDDLPDVAVLKF